MRFFSWDYLISTLILFGAMIIVPVIFSSEIFEPMTQSLSDFRITDIIDSKIVERDQLMADTNMVLVNTEIDNNEISNLGLAKLINVINSFQPKVIGIKKIVKKSNNPEHDRLLSMVLANCKNLIMANRFLNYNKDTEEFDSIAQPDKMFSLFATVGFDNCLQSTDERFFTIRTVAPRLRAKGNNYLSFSLKVAELYNPKKGKELVKRNNPNDVINYLGNFQFFRMEVNDVLEQNFEPELFKNKIVLLGRISTKDAIDSTMALKDVFFTPLNDSYTGKAFPDMYGTVLQANIISMILNSNYFDSMPEWLIYLIAVILVYLNMVIFTYIIIKNKKWYEILSLAVFVIESIVILFLTMISFISFKYEMNLTVPIFSIALSVLTFEIYNSSLKPLTIRLYYKFFHKG